MKASGRRMAVNGGKAGRTRTEEGVIYMRRSEREDYMCRKSIRRGRESWTAGSPFHEPHHIRERCGPGDPRETLDTSQPRRIRVRPRGGTVCMDSKAVVRERRCRKVASGKPAARTLVAGQPLRITPGIGRSCCRIYWSRVAATRFCEKGRRPSRRPKKATRRRLGPAKRAF
jgi:hypothetical protein